MGRYKTALDDKRYNWRHGSILELLSNFFKTTKNIKMHSDIEGYMNQSAITEAEDRQRSLFLS